MADYQVKVLAVKDVTHNVHAFTIEKPAGFTYAPGEATDLSILKENWKAEKRPFTFTSLPESETLEFTIKSYTDHDGVTNQLTQIKPGDNFEISDAWGAISYQGEGVFLAGGAGITPFIAIFRHLYSQNKVGSNRLFFSNKTVSDIILKEEFEEILGEQFFNLISSEQAEGFYQGRIDKKFLQTHIRDFSQPFYVCGPDAFTSSILSALEELGAKAESLVFEK
ncbi:FAD-binding oxidoreductase [Dyadobacter sp. 3J3]|uniref:FAD-binding oxidoreductase n=1 Tax=Dyadobacter sp. 3J3 TaxID=2606600 RepID=UPI001358428B|nr:FAD-binding oxidoreductase [Dyadobacter sp. 3J3]